MKTCNSLLHNNSYQILFIYSFLTELFTFLKYTISKKKKFFIWKKKPNPVSMVFLLKAAFIDMLNKTNASLYQNHYHSFPVSGEGHLYKWKARTTSPSWYSIDVTCNILKWLFWGWIFSFFSQAAIERLCLENNQLLLDLVFGFVLWWSFCLIVFRGTHRA